MVVVETYHLGSDHFLHLRHRSPADLCRLRKHRGLRRRDRLCGQQAGAGGKIQPTHHRSRGKRRTTSTTHTAGQVDKETQNVAWRIGDNKQTVLTTTLANLTQDVSTVAIHFSGGRVQTWLLVRMPEPSPADQPPKAPEINRKPPPVTPIPVKTAP